MSLQRRRAAAALRARYGAQRPLPWPGSKESVARALARADRSFDWTASRPSKMTSRKKQTVDWTKDMSKWTSRQASKPRPFSMG